jgi:hypothetical protein
MSERRAAASTAERGRSITIHQAGSAAVAYATTSLPLPPSPCVPAITPVELRRIRASSAALCTGTRPDRSR